MVRAGAGAAATAAVVVGYKYLLRVQPELNMSKALRVPEH